MPGPETLGVELTRILREAQAESRAPSIVAAVTRNGESVWTDAVGLADIDANAPATPEHQFRIGSITKTFTAVALMQLRDEGKVDLDDPADRYVEGARHAPTLRRMLAHVSGLQREPTGADWEAMDFGADNLVDAIAEAELILPGGAHWHYSNLAFAFLGEVVARVSGKPWAEVVDERILRPLGLERTTQEAAEPAARGYLVDPYADRATAEWSGGTSIWAPAGQLWSTVSDLTRWGSFLVDPDPKVLAPATAEEMRGFQAMADLQRWKLGWGLGLMLFRDGDRILAGHGGAMPGFLAGLAASPEQKVAVAVLTNSTGGVAIDEVLMSLAKKALDELPAEPEAWRPGEAPPPELE
ncbi:MAG: hypothetical protein QOE36_109, partial [Gaiellaceae bacterium]|nr:hypothetical protein [Gaiellaceae bacterium]